MKLIQTIRVEGARVRIAADYCAVMSADCRLVPGTADTPHPLLQARYHPPPSLQGEQPSDLANITSEL